MKQNFKILIGLIILVGLAVGFFGLSTQFVHAQGDTPPRPGGDIPSPCAKDTGKIRDKDNKCVCPSGQADPTNTEKGVCKLVNPAPGQLVGIEDFGQLLKKIIDIFLMFAGAIAVIFLMVGGFQYIASRGNEEATEKAKKTITNAIIGVVLIVMAFAIVNIVNTLLTKLPKEQAGTSKAPGPSGGPGGGGGQTQGGITVKAVDLRDFYTEADLITITFTADPSDSYSWGDNAPPNLGIELEASSDGSTAQLIWRARRGDAGKYNITVTATSDRGKAGSTTVLIDVREPGQSEP